MAETDRPTPAETPSFETDTVEANHAIENGQGVGARELAAQRDPGGVETADQDEELDGAGASLATDDDDLDDSVSVQGQP